jgi:hypothetical protein
VNATAKKSKSSLLYSILLDDAAETGAVLSLSRVLLKPIFLPEKLYEEDEPGTASPTWTAQFTPSALPPVEGAEEAVSPIVMSELSAARRSEAENPHDPTLVEAFEPQKDLMTSTAFIKSPLNLNRNVNENSVEGKSKTRHIVITPDIPWP